MKRESWIYILVCLGLTVSLLIFFYHPPHFCSITPYNFYVSPDVVEYKSDIPTKFELHLENYGNQSIKLVGLTSTCGCVPIKEFKQITVEPQNNQILELKMQTTKKETTSRLLLHIDDGVTIQEVILFAKGILK